MAEIGIEAQEILMLSGPDIIEGGDPTTVPDGIDNPGDILAPPTMPDLFEMPLMPQLLVE